MKVTKLIIMISKLNFTLYLLPQGMVPRGTRLDLSQNHLDTLPVSSFLQML